MLLQEPNLTVWLYTKPTDMRKQFDGLLALARQHLTPELQGGLFVFLNRRRTQMKALYYSLCLWSKRLEQGRFHQIKEVDKNSGSVNLTWGQLQCLIEGINWQEMKQNKRYFLPRKT